MPPDLSWLAALRDIHPGQGPIAGDEQQTALLALSGFLLLALALTWLLRQLLGRLKTRHQLLGTPLPMLHARLRPLSCAHWPDLAPLPTPAWLAALDTRAGTNLARWSPLWDHWVYGQQPLTELEHHQLEADIRRLIAALYPWFGRRRP